MDVAPDTSTLKYPPTAYPPPTTFAAMLFPYMSFAPLRMTTSVLPVVAMLTFSFAAVHCATPPPITRFAFS